jgi:hypothetical protein
VASGVEQPYSAVQAVHGHIWLAITHGVVMCEPAPSANTVPDVARLVGRRQRNAENTVGSGRSMPRKIRSRVLYLRTFLGAKSDNDMVAGFTEALSGVAKLVVMGPAEAEISLRRYWLRRYGDSAGLCDGVDFVVCTDDTWRREVHWQIGGASCILFYLSAKNGRFPAHQPPRLRKDLMDFYRAPLSRGSSGQGLLREIVYLRRLNKLPQTVLIIRRRDRQLIERMINLPMIGEDSGPLVGGYLFKPTPNGHQATTARFSAFDKQLISLQKVHDVVAFNTSEFAKSSAQSEFARDLRGSVRSVIQKDRWRRINLWARQAHPDILLGKSSNPRRLPPDDDKKIIQFTNVEDLLYIPRWEISDVSIEEIVDILSPDEVKSGCPGCGAPLSRLFFFVRSLQRKEGETIRARCQECLEPMIVEGDSLDWY